MIEILQLAATIMCIGAALTLGVGLPVVGLAWLITKVTRPPT